MCRFFSFSSKVNIFPSFCIPCRNFLEFVQDLNFNSGIQTKVGKIKKNTKLRMFLL